MLPCNMEWVLSVVSTSSHISIIKLCSGIKTNTAAMFQYSDDTPLSFRSEPGSPLQPVRALVLMTPSTAIAQYK